MSQRWLIRVASHPRHGGGHVARCGVLASALAAARADVLVQLDPASPDARARLEQTGLHCTETDTAGPWDGIVLDGYELMAHEAAILSRQAPLVVIDDFLDPPFEAALAINGAPHLAGDRIGNIPALLGPRYALVDPRFARLPVRNHTEPVRNMLVTMGRLDPADMTGRCLDMLAAVDCDCAITVVASSAAAKRTDLAERLHARDRLLVDVPDMLSLLAEADFIIGAGGVSLLERMAAGVPSLTLLLADNQRLFVEGAAHQGATIDCGSLGEAGCVTALRDILADGAARVAMASAARRVVDGQGAARVAQRLLAFVADQSYSRQAATRGAKA